ncbi:Hypothetical protein, putative [Bodo saltans]|uniref:Uncharacterized protein n=1 Tax=Bodo saltans TaxID=75058 RepID=A0A0S4JJS2_BODSA|nr:Hypothetical protein, putative [Bodo saltans]|eukprot:CUG90824.1 Hypothetical protein, putative [Bodo saltans]
MSRPSSRPTTFHEDPLHGDSTSSDEEDTTATTGTAASTSAAGSFASPHSSTNPPGRAAISQIPLGAANNKRSDHQAPSSAVHSRASSLGLPPSAPNSPPQTPRNSVSTSSASRRETTTANNFTTAPPPPPVHLDGPVTPLGSISVPTMQEANKLATKLRSLEQENTQLSQGLTRMAEENARLGDRVASLQEKVTRLSTSPLEGTSVLKALFDKDQHAGWLNGGKSATKEKLQHTLEDLQNEYIAYKETHTTSEDEVKALVTDLQSAHANSSTIAAQLREVKRQMQLGAVGTIRLIVEESNQAGASVKSLQQELQLMSEQHAEDLKAAAAMNESLQQQFDALEQQHHMFTQVAASEHEESLKTIQNLEQQVTQLKKDASAGKAAQESLQKLQVEYDEIQLANSKLEEELSTISNRLAVKEEMQKQLILEATQRGNSEVQEVTLKLVESEDLLMTEKERYSALLTLHKKQEELHAQAMERIKDDLQLVQEQREEADKANALLRRNFEAAEAARKEAQLDFEEEINALKVALKRANELAHSSQSGTAELESTHAETVAQLAQLQQQHSFDVAALQEKHAAEIGKLQKRLVEAQEVIADYESQLGQTVSLQNFLTLETKCQRLEDDVELLREQKATLESHAQANANNSTALEQERAQHAIVVAQLQQRLVTAQEVIADHESQLGQTVSLQNFLTLETEVQRLRDDVALLSEQKIAAEATAAHTAEELAMVQRTLADAVAKSQELRDELSPIRHRSAELDTVRASGEHDKQTIRALEARCDELELQIKALQEENSNLNASTVMSAQSLSDYEVEIAKYKEAVKHLEERAKALDAARESGESALESTYTQQIHDMRTEHRDEVAALTERHNRTMETATGLHTAAIAALKEQHSAEISKLQARLVQAQEIIADHESQLGQTVSLQNFLTLETKCQRLEDVNALLQEQRAALELAVSKHTNDAATLKQLQEQHATEISRLQKRLVEAQEVIADHESQLGQTVSLQNFLSLETKSQRLEDEVALLTEQKKALEVTVAEHVSAHAAMEAKHAAATQHLQDDIGRIRDEKAALDAVVAKNSSIATALEQLRSQHAAEIGRLQERLVKAQEVIADHESQLGQTVSLQNFLSLETSNKRLEDDVALLKEQRRALESTAAEHSAAMTALEEQHHVEIGKLQQRLVVAQEVIADHESQLVSMQNFMTLETKCQRLEDEAALLVEQKQAADKRLEEIQTTLNGYEEVVAKSMSLQAELTAAKEAHASEIKTLKQRSDLLVKKCAQLTAEKKTLERSSPASGETSTIITRDASAADLVAGDVAARDEVIKVREELLAAKADAQRISDEHDQSKLLFSQSQARVKELEVSVAEHATRLAASEEKAQKERAAMLAEIVACKEVMSEMDLLNTKSQLSSQQLAEVSSEKKRLEDEVSLQTARASELESELGRVQKRAASAAEDIQNLQAALKSVLQELQQSAPPGGSSGASTQLLEQNERLILKQRIHELEEECESLQTKLDSSRKEVDAMNIHFAQEMSNMMEAVSTERVEIDRKHNEEIAAAIAAAAAGAASGGSRRSTSQTATTSSGSATSELQVLQAKYEDVVQNKVRNESMSSKKIASLEAQVAAADERLQERVRAYEAELNECQRHIASLGGSKPTSALSAGRRRSSAAEPTSAASSTHESEAPSRSARSAVSASAAGAAGNVTADQYYNVKCENDRLHEELRRQASKFKEKEAEYQELLSKKPAGAQPATTPGRPHSPRATSPQSRQTSSATANESDDQSAGLVLALRTANASLMEEKEQLLRRVAVLEADRDPPVGEVAKVVTSGTRLYRDDDLSRQLDAATAKNERLTLQIVELKQKLDEKLNLNKAAAETFNLALDAAEKDAKAWKAKVAELEAQIAQLKRREAEESSTPTSTVAVTPPAQVVKTERVRKGTLGAAGRARRQGGASLLSSTQAPIGDILDITEIDPHADDAAELERLRTEVHEKQRDLDRRSTEVVTLKGKVQELLDELRIAQSDIEELQQPQGGEVASQSTETVVALQKEVAALKSQNMSLEMSVAAATAAAAAAAVPVGASSTNSAGSSSQLAKLQAALDTLTKENKEVSRRLDESKTLCNTLETRLATSQAKLAATEAAYKTLQTNNEAAIETQKKLDADASAAALAAAKKSSRPTSRSNSPSTSEAVGELPTSVEALQQRVRWFEEQMKQRDASDAEMMQQTQVSVMEMDKRVRLKVKEAAESKQTIVQLTSEFLPLKQKLVEYESFVDRLGIRYPLPDQVSDGVQVVRLHALQASSGVAAAPSAAAPRSAVATPDASRRAAPSFSTPMGAGGGAARATPAASRLPDPSPIAPPRPRDKSTKRRELPT